jgi:hypothetical protein
MSILLALFIDIPSVSAKRHRHRSTKTKMRMDYKPQNELGSISGKIMGDLQPVSGATILVTQKDKIIDQVVSDENGYYTIKYLTPGRFDIKASKDDYRTVIFTAVPVSEDHTIKNDFYLPRFNNAHMPRYPIVETYERHISHMRHN